ncbi:hypothetical protein PsorP6_016358 [Peronosclerospora sorghi]|uniref:Uncharacterized protein n=1 Tax=Peronosclerospora sorghi TaxID=230839 RepID=A0ACC0VJD1_9STRA|nr:hypothetical protein PsorP6_016358 [Peronosclerospora sorghi]
MVCELCGTQSFLEARNETQDAEDMGMDVATVSKTLKQRRERKPKRKMEAEDGAMEQTQQRSTTTGPRLKVRPTLPPLRDCVLATQMVLDAMARTLVARIGPDTFPAQAYPNVVRSLWFKFLETWGVKGTKPLLHCYNEFFLYYTREEEKEESMDPAVTMNLLEQWNAEWERNQNERAQLQERAQDDTSGREEGGEEEEEEEEEDDESDDERTPRAGDATPRRKDKYVKTNVRQPGTLNKFSMVDLIGLLMLASRVLNLGLVPSDFAEWVATGVIPYHNALATTCAHEPAVKESVKFVAQFFQAAMKRHRARTVQIAYAATHLMYHMGLRLPPLNVPLAVHRLCATMGFPNQVFRNFQWIAGYMNVTGDVPEPPLLLQAERDGCPRFSPPTEEDKARVDGILESEVGIVAHVVVAIKMCANWHEWIYERREPVEDEEDEEHADDESKRNDHKRQRTAPPAAAVHTSDRLTRRDLDAYTAFARQVLVNPDRCGVPDALHEHVDELARIEDAMDRASRRNALKQNVVYAYPALHVDGVLAETDQAIEQRLERLRARATSSAAAQAADTSEHSSTAFFYPRLFLCAYRSGLHAATEHVLELLCRKIDAPIASVLPLLAELDKRMQSLICHFERTAFHVNVVEQGHAQWKAREQRTIAHRVVRA